MTSGRIAKSKGKLYAVLYWTDPATHKRVEKWIGLKMDIKGNIIKAKHILNELKANFEPNDIVKSNLLLMRLGLNPIADDGKRMKKVKIDEIVKKESKDNIPVVIAQDMQNGLILFSNYMKIWLDKVKPDLRETTYAGYYNNIYSIIAPYFEKRRIYLQDITPEDIEAFYHEMLQTHNSNTVIRYHANIRKALQYAFKKGFILTNPADRVDRPKKTTYAQSFYNKEELEKLIEVARGTALEFPVIMASYYGLRREEVVGLKWDAIDFQYKQFTIKHTVTSASLNGKRVEIAKDTTKTKKSFRTLPFDNNGIIESLLLKMKNEQEQWKELFGNTYNYNYEEYVYVRPDGVRYKADYISEAFPLLLQKNNLRKIRFHDLRHTCATMLRHTGVPMEDIQKYLGHSTITTTEGIYAHFDDSKHKKTVASLSNFLNKDEEMDK